MDGSMDIAVEAKFAQLLGSNEKKIRDKGLKKLRNYISSRSEGGTFTENDFLKIWKGLFYGMWMCDKPVFQEELSDRISALLQHIHKFHTALLFIKVFFITISREWNGIDQLRMDKFLKLVRKMLSQSFHVLKKNQWTSKNIKQFNAVLSEEAINKAKDKGPTELKFYIIEIYLEELAKVAQNDLSSEQVMRMLDPFFSIMTSSDSSPLMGQTDSNIFKSIADSHLRTVESNEVRIKMAAIEDKDTVEMFQERLSNIEYTIDCLDFDFAGISERCQRLLEKRSANLTNRKRLTRLQEIFEKIAEGRKKITRSVEKPDTYGKFMKKKMHNMRRGLNQEAEEGAIRRLEKKRARKRKRNRGTQDDDESSDTDKQKSCDTDEEEEDEDTHEEEDEKISSVISPEQIQESQELIQKYLLKQKLRSALKRSVVKKLKMKPRVKLDDDSPVGAGRSRKAKISRGSLNGVELSVNHVDEGAIEPSTIPLDEVSLIHKDVSDLDPDSGSPLSHAHHLMASHNDSLSIPVHRVKRSRTSAAKKGPTTPRIFVETPQSQSGRKKVNFQLSANQSFSYTKNTKFNESVFDSGKKATHGVLKPSPVTATIKNTTPKNRNRKQRGIVL